jgi:hypothetical protein
MAETYLKKSTFLAIIIAMKQTKLFILTVLLCTVYLASVNGFAQSGKNFPVLKGPYLGQTPPGKTPTLFAPGIITTDISEGCSGWGNHMEYFIFQRWVNRKSKLYIMNQVNGVWSAPAPMPFLDKYQVGDFTFLYPAPFKRNNGAM